MTKEKWYDSDDPEKVVRGGAWFTLRWVLLVVVVVAVIGAAIWGIGVATSNTAGRGNAVKQKNTALNRTQAQAQFHAGFEQVRALDQKLTDAQKTLATFNAQHPNVGNGSAYDPLAERQGYLETNLTGAQQQCRNAVASYNGDTETYTLRDFRDSDLPFKMQADDPVFASEYDFADFDCQPTH